MKQAMEMWNWAMEDPVTDSFFFGCLSLSLSYIQKTQFLAKLKVAFNKPQFQHAYWLQKQRDVRIHNDMPPFDLSITQVYSP